MPYPDETLRRTLKHLLFKPEFAVLDETTCSQVGLARKEKPPEPGSYLIKDFYEVLCLFLGERGRGRAVW